MPKILIIDDSPDNQDSLAGRLQCRGFDVVMAPDGKRGIAMVAAEKPDLILMDMNMPEMDGWEATRRIKATAEGTHVPIIAMTENALVGNKERALQAGCIDSHDKPIDFANLLVQIEALLTAQPQT
jgi:CheY-like chemotaxis protein